MRLESRSAKLRPSGRVKVRLPEKRTDPFYKSPEWEAYRANLIRQRFGSPDNARCEDPQCKTPHRRGIRIFVHHVDERRDGGSDLPDPSKALCICGACHTRVTAANRAKRG